MATLYLGLMVEGPAGAIDALYARIKVSTRITNCTSVETEQSTATPVSTC